MHIVLGFLAVLGAAAFWIYRLRDAGRAVGEVVDTAERVRGFWRRKKFLAKAEGSVITAINDPVIGAGVMMIAVAGVRGPISDKAMAVIRQQYQSIADKDPAEDLTFARWAVDQSPDPDNISLKLASLWNSSLNAEQKREFVSMVMAVAEADGPPLPAQAATIRKLRERLSV